MATSHVDPSFVAFLPDARSRVMAATHDSIDIVDRLPTIRACDHYHTAYPLRDGRGLIVASVSSPSHPAKA